MTLFKKLTEPLTARFCGWLLIGKINFCSFSNNAVECEKYINPLADKII